jgi:hypothetical protein
MKQTQHPERHLARRYDCVTRSREFQQTVHSGYVADPTPVYNRLRELEQEYFPPAPEYQVYYGELHGHTCLSDGGPTVDEYFTSCRDRAKLDFAAIADHTHGGVGHDTIWGEKWEIIRDAVKRYYEPHKFTTVLAYEEEADPWYSNCVIYFDNHDADMIPVENCGWMSREELHRCLAREDLLIVPHDSNNLAPGTDFLALEPEDMPPLIQVHSRRNFAEKTNEPEFYFNSDCEGGHWQDALNKGARMGCIACSDDHDNNMGLVVDSLPYPCRHPGLTGVWAKENTLPAIFEALKARRCYGFMGGRISLDFRINGHYMGEEIQVEGDRVLYYNVEADAPVDTVTVVKNGRDYIMLKSRPEMAIFDYRPEQETDYYYIRVRLTDGRFAWSSPIWVSGEV